MARTWAPGEPELFGAPCSLGHGQGFAARRPSAHVTFLLFLLLAEGFVSKGLFAQFRSHPLLDDVIKFTPEAGGSGLARGTGLLQKRLL